MTDLYAVLGVDRGADRRTIRAAYRTLARRYHPDLGGDPADMMRVNEAGRVLGDPQRRASYDAQHARTTKTPRQRDGRSVMEFGRYAGWSLDAIAAHDEDYLVWLGRTQTGRPLQLEIAGILSERANAVSALQRPPTPY
ncbi:MAG: DnaJ domain-containing protein, partial [Chloroflexi bacterium]|nr:DnaJ domain-containing protein [Chloroflexota bacterium]